MLDRAEAGRYSQVEVNRGLPAPMLVRHFERGRRALAGVAARCAATVTFKRLNLAAPLPPMPQFDVIFLRNVLIYFDVATKKPVLRQVARAADAGRLAVPRLGRDDDRDRRPVRAGGGRPDLRLPAARR